MKIKTKEEISRIYRYVIVKAISKGEYVVVSVATYFSVGSTYVPYAFAVSFFFSNILDFLGQKFLVFKNKKELSWKVLREIFFYSSLRMINFLCATFLFYLLTENLKMSIVAAGLVVASIFIPIGFLLYRWLFFGTIQDLLVNRK